MSTSSSADERDPVQFGRRTRRTRPRGYADYKLRFLCAIFSNKERSLNIPNAVCLSMRLAERALSRFFAQIDALLRIESYTKRTIEIAFVDVEAAWCSFRRRFNRTSYENQTKRHNEQIYRAGDDDFLKNLEIYFMKFVLMRIRYQSGSL